MLRKWTPKPMARRADPASPAAAPAAPRPPAKPAEPPDPGPILGLGPAPWAPGDILAALEEFSILHARRPIPEDEGGMRSVGLFALTFMLGRLAPEGVLLSGVGKGQTAWAIRETLPGAALLALDPNPGNRRCEAEGARYLAADFLSLDPASLGFDPAAAVAVFDDHRDVFPRIARCREAGIRHLIFEGNYPGQAGGRHVSLAACLNDRAAPPAGGAQAAFRFPDERRQLLEWAETYWIFPPVFDHAEPVTMEKSLIEGESLLGEFHGEQHAGLGELHRDMWSYRWTSYLALK